MPRRADLLRNFKRGTRSWLWCCALLGLGVALVTSCSNDASALAKRNAKLFQAADPQVKALWESANLAMQTNGFLPATLALQKLHQAQLTPEQLRAVEQMGVAVSDQMYDAANKGDPKGTEAIKELRKLNAR